MALWHGALLVLARFFKKSSEDTSQRLICILSPLEEICPLSLSSSPTSLAFILIPWLGLGNSGDKHQQKMVEGPQTEWQFKLFYRPVKWLQGTAWAIGQARGWIKDGSGWTGGRGCGAGRRHQLPFAEESECTWEGRWRLPPFFYRLNF